MGRNIRIVLSALPIVLFLSLLTFMSGCKNNLGGGHETPPAAPSLLAASALSSSSIRLTWTDNSDNETGFKIQRSPNGVATWALVTTAGEGTTLYDDQGLSSSTTYYYRVCATSSLADSDWSNTAFAATPPIGGSPAISLSPMSLSFSAVQGGASPAAKTVSVTNIGAGTLSGLSTSVSYTNGSGWLSASLDTATAPATLTVTATTGSFAAGTYNATVSVSSVVASNSPQTVAVSFVISSSGPAISLSPTSLSFSAVQGGASPAAKTVSVTNIGTGTLSGLSASVSYANGSGWLSASLNTTTAPATLTVTATTGSLAAGTYNATVSVSSGVASNSPQTVAVSFAISAGATYTLTTSVSPAASGSVARNPDAASYSSGTVVTLTATPNSGYAFSNWSGGATGMANPTTVTMNANKSVTAYFSNVPVLSGPSSATGPFQLTWTYTWPGLVSTNDHYELEYSYNQTSGYTLLAKYPDNVRTSPYTDTITPEAVDIGKTSYFRVRALVNGNYTSYSNVVAVSVPYLNLTFYPNYDNGMLYNSQDSSVANAVYSNAKDMAGASYFYDMYGYLFGYLVGSSAFRFDINNFIAGRTINKATLILWPYDLPGDFTGTYAVNALANNWSGSTITFNNCPSYYTGSVSTKGAPVSTAVSWNFDVTAIVRAWASGSMSNYGLLLRDYNIQAPGYSATEGSTSIPWSPR